MIWLSVLIWVSLVVGDTEPHSGAMDGSSQEYLLALDKISNYTPKPLPLGIYDDDHIWNIPEYRPTINDYDRVVEEDLDARKYMEEQVVPLLEAGALKGHVDSLVALGDIYIFGNLSIATNYTKSLEYYHQAVDIQSNGHAYFMLGYMYSTGMFGEVELNQGKAQLFYELGLKLDDINAMLALAYRFARGIGTPKNCDLALLYYSKLAQIGYQYYITHEDEIEPTDISYDIKIPDFNGGIYGEDVTESMNSVAVSKKQFLLSYEQEYSIDNFDRKIVLNYFSALDEYGGYYDSPRNFTRAKELLQDCADYGEKLYGYKKPLALSSNDKYRLSQCQTLLGHMYLKGQGTKKDYNKAFKYLKDLTRIFNTTDALNDLGLMYQHGLYNNEVDERKVLEYYSVGHNMGSEKASKNLAKYLISKIPYGDLISTTERPEIVKMMRKAATSGDTEALYHYFEFIQSGFTEGVFKQYSCESTLIYPRVFLERLQNLFYPHLKYATEQLGHGNYKNALTGFLIAAEQGLEKAQVSSGWLLYQLDPFPMKGKKSYQHERVLSAMNYFQRASNEGDIDSTIFLGDIYFYGVPSANITHNYEKAFDLYSIAVNSRSPHGCFSLAYMYEHGLGVVNNSIDFFMAKRYYDLSLKYKDLRSDGAANKIPIYFTLLKLRIKYLLWGYKTQLVPENTQQASWFSNFKKLGSNEDGSSFHTTERAQDRAQERAREQHEGESYFIDDEIGLGDYFVLAITFTVFMALLIKNLIQQYRRMRNRDGGNPNDINQGDNQRQQGWEWNWNGINFRGGNFEFHFFAL